MAARTNSYAESNGESTTTASSYQDKTSLTFSPASSDVYHYIWCSQIFGNATTHDTDIKLINSTTPADLNDYHVESKDPSDYPSIGGIYQETFGASPPSQTLKIQYQSETAGTTHATKNSRIIAILKNADDQYAASDGDSTTTSTTLQDKTTLTWIPAAGDWVIIASAGFKVSSTGGHADIALDVDGSSVETKRGQVKDVSNFASWVAVKQVTLTNASHTIKIQFNNVTGGSTTTIRQARILVMTKAAFEAAFYDEQRTRQTTTSTTPSAALSGTHTPANVEHIVIACAGQDYSDNTESSLLTFSDGTTTWADTIKEPDDVSTIQQTFFTFYRATLAASSTTWSLNHSSEGSGDTTGTDELSITILQTGAASGDVNANPSGVAATGQVNTPTVTGDANVTPDGVAGTGAVGDPTVTLLITAEPSGVAGTGQAGDVTVTADANVTPTGVAGTGQVGDPTIDLLLTVDVTGVEATGQVGDPSIVIDVSAAPTGVQATGQVGDPTVTIEGGEEPPAAEDDYIVRARRRGRR